MSGAIRHLPALKCRVDEVRDADTFEISVAQPAEKHPSSWVLRFVDLDTAEMDTEAGKEQRAWATKWVEQHQPLSTGRAKGSVKSYDGYPFTVYTLDTDFGRGRWGRVIGKLADPNGDDYETSIIGAFGSDIVWIDEPWDRFD